MGAWKLESAKARLSEVLRQAKDQGPQMITVRGRDAAVLMSVDEYRRLKDEAGDGKSWVDRLREIGPIDLDLERDDSLMRDIDW